MNAFMYYQSLYFGMIISRIHNVETITHLHVIKLSNNATNNLLSNPIDY